MAMIERKRMPETTLASGGAVPASRLLLVAGGGHFGTYALVKGKTLVIGRDQFSDIRLVDRKISRRHAYIHVGETIEIEDLGSKNGTRLAGRALGPGERTLLETGMNLQIGPFVAVVLQSSGDAVPEQPLRAAIPITDPTPTGVPSVLTRVAAEMVSVLITGETGVGKEVLARTIHELSGRTGQLVAINCASLSESLLESELFGHERGSFTGAGAAKPGLFEVAGGGTVFLDEIGELPPGLQARLLRVLETRTVYRVGGVKPVQLDVRFVAATHRDLAGEVARGTFRRDLFFRINGIVLAIAPLRERRDAIPNLARQLLAGAVTPGKEPPRLSNGALDALMRHGWPGNVRELRTVMERAVVVCDGDEIRASHLLFDDMTPSDASPQPVVPSFQEPANDVEESHPERQRIIAALADCAGNQTYAARKLGISRTTLQHKLAVHRIPRPRKPRE